MARRRAVTREQLGELLALPVAEPELIRHWTLSAGDLAAIERHRRDPNQLGLALQLCAFRYPGRLSRPREVIPDVNRRGIFHAETHPGSGSRLRCRPTARCS